MPKNPSELQRLYEEMEVIRQQAFDLRLRKPVREALLVELRKIEALLGIESSPYNSSN